MPETSAIPTPMDAWRAALDILIACAPGSEVAVAWHLSNARLANWAQVDRSAATPGAAALVDRLMLLAAGGLISQPSRRDDELRNAFGLPHPSPVVGMDLSFSGRCERVAHAMGMSRQALYVLLQSMGEQGASQTQALSHLEALHLPGADQ